MSWKSSASLLNSEFIIIICMKSKEKGEELLNSSQDGEGKVNYSE